MVTNVSIRKLDSLHAYPQEDAEWAFNYCLTEDAAIGWDELMDEPYCSVCSITVALFYLLA